MTAANEPAHLTIMNESEARPRPLSRRAWTLLAIGLLAWVGLGAGGVWFVHQVTRPQGTCRSPADEPTHQVKGAATTPQNALQAITGQGRCR
jgi:hypothetical protein